MNVRLYDGTVRCPEHFDASSYESETSEPCLYCIPAAPVAEDEGWTVRRVTSGTHGPACPCPKSNGTRASYTTDVESIQGLLGVVQELSEAYGYQAWPSWVGQSSYRWTFEKVTPDGHRITDMVLASLIG